MELKTEDLTPFKVTVRVRPLSDKEKTLKVNRIIRIENSMVMIYLDLNS